MLVKLQFRQLLGYSQQETYISLVFNIGYLICSIPQLYILGTNGLNRADVPLSKKQMNIARSVIRESAMDSRVGMDVGM